MNELLGFDVSRSGKMYDDLSEVFTKTRKQAVNATTEYNALYGKDEQKRKEILQKLLGSVGEDPFFEQDFRCEFGKNIHLGDRFYANFDCILLDGGEIIIGNDVLFGPRVGIFTTNHATYSAERKAGGCYSKNFVIKDNVWVGANVTINQGVTIGENTIIGSGSVLTKSIPADVIAVGNPCRVLRKITEQDKTGYQSNRHSN